VSEGVKEGETGDAVASGGLGTNGRQCQRGMCVGVRVWVWVWVCARKEKEREMVCSVCGVEAVRAIVKEWVGVCAVSRVTCHVWVGVGMSAGGER
jgi:hypothetical protein